MTPIVILIEQLEGGGWLISHGSRGDPKWPTSRAARNTPLDVSDYVRNLAIESAVAAARAETEPKPDAKP